MALRRNPLTGQLEEDGLPADPNAPPGIEAPPTQFNTTDGGGAAAVPGLAQPLTVQVGSPQRPISEVEQRTPSEQTAAAQTALDAARTQTNQANAAVGRVEQKEAALQGPYAQQRVEELDAQQTREQEAEEARRKQNAAKQDADQREIQAEKKARIDAGRGNELYWEGRPVAEIFTRLLQVVGGVAHQASGQQGPSPVSQALSQHIAAYEKKLLGKYEATKGANAAQKAGREEKLAEMERVRILASNRSKLTLELIDEQLNAAIAGLSPEKQKAARQAKDAAIAEARANEDKKSAQLYDAMSKRMTFAPGAGAGGSLPQGQAEAAGALTSMTTELKRFQGVKVSQAALEKWQSNQLKMGGADKTAGQGLVGTTMVDKLRSWGLSPKQEFEDIGDSDKKAILARKRGLDQLSKIMTGAAATDAEVKRREQQWLIQPGDSDEIIADKTQAFMDFIRDRSIAAGGAAAGVRSNLAASQAGVTADPGVREFVDKKTGQRFMGRVRPDGKIEAVE
jgi:hypothetical protein